MAGAIMTSSEPPKHDALLRLFAKIEQDPITVHEALEDIRAVSGENIRKDIEGLEIRMTARFDTTDARIDTIDARFDTIDARFNGLQREISSLRWMIGVGFTLLSIFIALSTFLGG